MTLVLRQRIDDQPRHGGDVDDRAALLFDHHRADLAADQEHPGQVHVDHLLPRLQRHGFRGVLGVGPRVVHENIDMRKRLPDLFHHVFDRFLAGNVGGNADTADLLPPNEFRRPLEFRFEHSGDHDIGPRLCIADGDFKPDAAFSAGNDRGFSFQAEQVGDIHHASPVKS